MLVEAPREMAVLRLVWELTEGEVCSQSFFVVFAAIEILEKWFQLGVYYLPNQWIEDTKRPKEIKRMSRNIKDK